MSSELNPKTTHYEFMGTLGASAIPIFLPLTIYGLYYACLDQDHCSVTEMPKLPTSFKEVFSWDALVVVVVWFQFQALLYIFACGETVQGQALRTGQKLEYKINGLRCFYLSLSAVLIGHALHIFRLEYLADNYIKLATASILFSYALSVFVYLKSFQEGALLALGGNTGNVIYDFFIGRELNPRIGNFDLKYFCELRPGLIGWVIINFGFVAAQYRDFGEVTPALVLVVLFQFYYVWDAFNSERSILTTMDIVQDGFGFMLAFGDLAWVPFTYSLQARFIASGAMKLSFFHLFCIVAIKYLGYYIFRGANGQKDTFRRNPHDPSVRHLQTLPTERGTKLLISGWWGIARHINYFGDLLMGLAWCLPTGFSAIIPYFYFIYFAILLIHRDLRDDHACHLKYGKDWEKYKQIVPYRIFPYIY